MTYTYDEVLRATVSWFDGDELASTTWVGKYALQNEKGEYLERTPSDMFDRLAREFARIEAKYPNPMSCDEIRELLEGIDPLTGKPCFGDVVAQGSPMSGIGNQHKLQSLSNCFVIPSAYDSYSGILRADEEQISIMKRRGGVGHDISTLRPKGMHTANAAGTTDGIGIFMERFSRSTREVAQGGRRGALMLCIQCNHPEIETFIDIKRDRSKVTGANISIKLTDDFMRAVESDSDYSLQWPVDVPLRDAKVTKIVRARELWKKMVSAAHESAEPGLLFWDNILNNGPADVYPEFRSIAVNPCAEISLGKFGACRLMLLNLHRFVLNPYVENARFDFERFSAIVQKAQRLMDDLVDLELECVDRIIAKIESDPEPEHIKHNELELWRNIRQEGERGRRTGLGITGLGDAMAACGIKYGSPESVEWVESVYRALETSAYRSSVRMAEERGAFPAFDAVTERGHAFLERVLDAAGVAEEHAKVGRRNIALTTTAPAGSVSILTRTTSGCEPVFRLSYLRRKKINPNDASARVDFVDAQGDKWQHFTVYHPGLERWMDITGENDVERSPYFGAASDEIDWRRRVEIQAAAQRWICHSISSTINLPKDTTVETVWDIYMSGWRRGLKGLTIYRDGCRDGVLISEPTSNETMIRIVENDAPKRPKELKCDIHHAAVRGEKYVVLVGLLSEKPYEVFAGLSKNVEIPKKFKNGLLIKNGKNDENISTYNLKIPVGDDEHLVIKDVIEQFDNRNYGAFSRIISTSLRHGVPLKFLCEQLRKDKHSDVTSFASVIARVLSKNYVVETETLEEKCDACGSKSLKRENGCVSCAECGNSRCS